MSAWPSHRNGHDDAGGGANTGLQRPLLGSGHRWSVVSSVVSDDDARLSVLHPVVHRPPSPSPRGGGGGGGGGGGVGGGASLRPPSLSAAYRFAGGASNRAGTGGVRARGSLASSAPYSVAPSSLRMSAQPGAGAAAAANPGDDAGDDERLPRVALIDRVHELTEPVRYRLLAQLLEDGIHARQFAVGLSTETGLWWYEYAHSATSRAVYSVAMLCFLFLIFFEKPSSDARAAKFHAALSPDVTVPIELMLLMVVWLDIYAQLRYQGRRWRNQLCRPTWLASRVFVAVAITFDLVTTPLGVDTRFSRPLRVWILLARLRNLRNALSMALRTLPNVGLIGSFLVFLMLLFSLVGWLIFDPANPPWGTIHVNATTSGLCSSFDQVCNGYFATFPNALYQMYILLAGINYPDAMLPYYQLSAWSSIFFIAYLTLGNVFLMRLLITAAYGAYREELFKRIEVREDRATRAFTCAFRIVTGARESAALNEGGIGMDQKTWLKLVRATRPKFRRQVAQAIFTAAVEGERDDDEWDEWEAAEARKLQAVREQQQAVRERTQQQYGNQPQLPPQGVTAPEREGVDTAQADATAAPAPVAAPVAGAGVGAGAAAGAAARATPTAATAATAAWKGEAKVDMTLQVVPADEEIQQPGQYQQQQQQRGQDRSISTWSSRAGVSGRLKVVHRYARFVEMVHMLDVRTRQHPTAERWQQPGCVGSVRRCSWRIFSVRWVRRTFDALALGSVLRLCLVRTRVVPTYGSCVEHFTASCTVDFIGYFIMFVFALEQVLKVLALGWREYWQSWLNRLDFFVSMSSVTATVALDIWTPSNTHNVVLTLAQVLPVVRVLRLVGQVFRLIRLMRFSRKAKKMLALVAHVIPNAVRLLAIIGSALYFYSVVGMEAFAGCLSDLKAINGSSYDVQRMHALTFDSFASSLVTSFTMLLVRKYPVLLEGTVACYGDAIWPMVFYFSFYIFVVCFLLNVFVAFILAVFNEVESHITLDGEVLGALGQNVVEDAFEREEDAAGDDGDNSSTRSMAPQHPSLQHGGSFRATRTDSGEGLMGTPVPMSPRSRAISDYLDGQDHPAVALNRVKQSRGSIHLRNKVQDLLLRSDVPYRSSPRRRGSMGTEYSSGGASSFSRGGGKQGGSNRIILRNTGPRARDVERLMLQRHRQTNSSVTSGGSGGGALISLRDGIHQRVASESERTAALAAVSELVKMLGVEPGQLTLSAGSVGHRRDLSGGSLPGGGGRHGRDLSSGSTLPAEGRKKRGYSSTSSLPDLRSHR